MSTWSMSIDPTEEYHQYELVCPDSIAVLDITIAGCTLEHPGPGWIKIIGGKTLQCISILANPCAALTGVFVPDGISPIVIGAQSCR